ncbi:hypothetical protein COS50_02295 [Candidatus Roizmanbacteria bacterium CG03_land_8_20_14_0_80_35_26]|uniref:Uncharacterized protein n=1 Tax=Candidatus Roizmanbacteria bacterium CG03_land_8_20_14_0_80_35_26 TaxID=1974845 RepID=A0A2M7BWU1_9BACT|nr:MAG: hypothetical protein COS50_02295 [Candidatus Roizmanbacteria bacterium CG03_land_8_20_14_0_80_35_26]
MAVLAAPNFLPLAFSKNLLKVGANFLFLFYFSFLSSVFNVLYVALSVTLFLIGLLVAVIFELVLL